jgi:hypothetical protein
MQGPGAQEELDKSSAFTVLYVGLLRKEMSFGVDFTSSKDAMDEKQMKIVLSVPRYGSCQTLAIFSFELNKSSAFIVIYLGFLGK